MSESSTLLQFIHLQRQLEAIFINDDIPQAKRSKSVTVLSTVYSVGSATVQQLNIITSSAKVSGRNTKQGGCVSPFLYSDHAFVSSLLLMEINLQSMALYQPRWHKGQRYKLIKYTSAIDISHGSIRVWDLLIKSVIMFTYHKHFPCLSTERDRAIISAVLTD